MLSVERLGSCRGGFSRMLGYRAERLGVCHRCSLRKVGFRCPDDGGNEERVATWISGTHSRLRGTSLRETSFLQTLLNRPQAESLPGQGIHALGGAHRGIRPVETGRHQPTSKLLPRLGSQEGVWVLQRKAPNLSPSRCQRLGCHEYRYLAYSPPTRPGALKERPRPIAASQSG